MTAYKNIPSGLENDENSHADRIDRSKNTKNSFHSRECEKIAKKWHANLRMSFFCSTVGTPL